MMEASMNISTTAEQCGYLGPAYAASLAEFGQPLELPQSGGWLLKRRIPGTDLFDAMGCYPLFSCQDWKGLKGDLQNLGNRLVSVSLVTDPFGNWEAEDLKGNFDTAFHFKDHYICDLAADPDQFISKHHRRYARKSLEHSEVELVDNAELHVNEWMDLYSVLVRRHCLTGIKAFSRSSFEKQLAVPGMVMMKITRNATVLGALLWLIQDRVAHAHLMALNEEGYAANAFYGLFWRSIEIFRGAFASRVSFLNFGGGSGSAVGEADGMIFFKKGLSTGVRPVWFCGKILDRVRYDEMVSAKGAAGNSDAYFPAYRKGEF